MPIKKKVALEKKCFVSCPFGDENTKERQRSDGVFKLIKEALSPLGYETYRTLDNESSGSITTRIVKELINADLVVADLTGLNPNVFYELAIRHCTGKPFIHIAQEQTDIPFNIFNLNVIRMDGQMSPVQGAEFIKKIRSMAEKSGDDTDVFMSDVHRLMQPTITPVSLFKWVLNYPSDLADKWLNVSKPAFKSMVHKYHSEGGVPKTNQEKEVYAEWLTYQASQGTELEGELYFFPEGNMGLNKGWANFLPPIGGSQIMAIPIRAHQVGSNIKIDFTQPPRTVKLSPSFDVSVRGFTYSVSLKWDKLESCFKGQIKHPDAKKLIVAETKLIEI
jgi:hypothetical protein